MIRIHDARGLQLTVDAAGGVDIMMDITHVREGDAVLHDRNNVEQITAQYLREHRITRSERDRVHELVTHEPFKFIQVESGFVRRFDE